MNGEVNTSRSGQIPERVRAKSHTEEGVLARLGEAQFTSYITGIMAMKPDFVVGCVASNDNVAWMEQAKTYGFFDKIPYPGSLITVTELMLQAKTLTRGIIALTRAPFFAHMDNPMMADFR